MLDIESSCNKWQIRAVNSNENHVYDLQADWMCLLANTSEGKAHENKSLIIVPMDTPGVIKAKKIDKGPFTYDVCKFFDFRPVSYSCNLSSMLSAFGIPPPQLNVDVV